MNKNMGGKDKLARSSAAVLIAVLYFGGIISGIWGIAMMIVAGIFVLTSLMSFCPLYTLFGINTCPRRKN